MLKNEKGITLIALIITIIVMLILVGVTINVALNGGLFEKAETAKEKTQKALEKEELILIAVAAYDANDREVKKTELNFNGKYTEETDKTTSEKVVVKGESGILWQIDIASAKVEEYTEETRVPFTNYIENGNNYYIYGDKTSSSYKVVTFSKESSTFTVYNVNDGQVSEENGGANVSFEIIDKNEIETRLGYTDDMVEQASGVTMDELSDDVMVWNMDGTEVANIFKSNYMQVIITNVWFTLDTTYTLPNE